MSKNADIKIANELVARIKNNIDSYDSEMLLITFDQLKKFEEYTRLWKEHQQIYQTYYYSEGEKYDSLGGVIMNYDDNKISVYFADLKLYGVYTPNNYSRLVKYFTINYPETKFAAKQIILSDTKQKITLLCPKENEIIIQNRAKEFFGVDPISCSNGEQSEILINHPVSKYDDVFPIFEAFRLYVYKKDKNVANNIFMQRSSFLGEKRYLEKNIYSCCSDLDIILALLQTYPRVMTTDIIIDTNIINSNKDNYAKEWIQNNPPSDEILTADYYVKYKNSTATPLHSNRFGPIVTSQGYEVRRGTKSRYWVKIDSPKSTLISSPVKKSYSKKQIIWMNFIAEEFSIDIQHAENSHNEHRVVDVELNKTYYVDGFCEINGRKIAFEFDGCYWHGCPKCNNPLETNAKSKQQYGQLYEKTFNRRSALVRLEYIIVKIRECKYDRIFDKKGCYDDELQEWIDKVWRKIFCK